jgi:hypothetical protein
MNESLKALLGTAVFFGCVGALTWLAEPPPGETWQYKVRWISLALIILPIPVLVWANQRKDKVPDILRKRFNDYFERDGFCFAIQPEVKDGFCQLAVYFQNRYEKQCLVSIALTPSSFFFKSNAPIQTLAFGINCEGASFGRVSTRWPVPVESQGKKASLDVAASVEYPNGRGKLLRYRDGLRVGAAKAEFWREGLIVIGAMSGAIVISKPARMEFVLPSGIASELAEPPKSHCEILWRPGNLDPDTKC